MHKAELRLSSVLNCGCRLHHIEFQPNLPFPQAVSVMASRAAGWFRDAEERHRCALVSPTNLCGFLPRSKFDPDIPGDNREGTPATSFGPVSECDLAR